jgi:cell division protein FtsZ
VLVQTVASVINLVQSVAEINVDFADMTTIIRDSGSMHVGFCKASGADRVQKVFETIRQSKLLDTTIDGARSVLLSVVGSPAVGLDEVEALATAVQEAVHPDANIILGLRLDKTEGDELQALIIATAIEIDK